MNINELRSKIRQIIYDTQNDYSVEGSSTEVRTEEIMSLIIPYICMIGDCKCNNVEDWSSK